ncbi:hypothetical protein EV198_0175 [Roseivirga ehrenbergii]|uniref:FUSC family protein n=1 Tax=Roseivirga ehrenbergii (strain DSM 102268 / JCM 13514 / KCTC 12282 / NCIMB 14502 / KMM 6017) TaxID=279360 RepID=A0A150X048_ROSEK|nr:hypothetical protein [Roseivirga ehrenbergii]KYG72121.1 hypothetical protein MB14_08715 [Roseivirga ehrenbergii]TCL13353.1 hypothetical protein EV198_0175 [Roseivirga ehrenbergii]
MKQEQQTASTEEELIQKQKKLKSERITTAFMIGLLIGIFIYSAITNGFKFFTFFPLILAYFFFWRRKKTEANNQY